MLLMELAQEISDFRSQHFLHQDRLGADHVDFDIPGAKRGRNLETDKAGTDHHGTPRSKRLGDKSPAVRERAEIMHVREIPARDLEPHRLGAGGEEERAVRLPAAAYQLYVPALYIDRRHACSQA